MTAGPDDPDGPAGDLVVDVTPPADDEPAHVLIYGDPAGLRRLAARLLAFADDPNRPHHPSEGEHWHFSPEGGPGVGGGLHPLSLPLTIGRLDAADGGREWFLGGARGRRAAERAAGDAR